jgi:hypothetical protein
MPADESPVTIFARRFQRRCFVRPKTLLSAALSGLCLSLSVLCAPAGAVVTVAGESKVGVQPREIARYTDGEIKLNGEKGAPTSNAEAANFENAAGHPVLHSSATYVIFWDPQHFYHGDWQSLIDTFMASAGTSSGQLESVFAVDAQYFDSTNHPAAHGFSFRGAMYDTNPYPEPSGCTDPLPFEFTSPLVGKLAVCLTDAQARAQIETVINQHSLPRGMGTVYYLLTPPGVASCLEPAGVRCSEYAGTITEIEEDETKKIEPAAYKSYKNSYCSYHGAIGAGGASTVLYAVIPWTAGGDADYQLAAKDQTAAYPCQDGALEPSKKPGEEVLEKEKVKTKTLQEQEEFEAKNALEKRKQEEAEALGLQGPHIQEPNQLGATRSEDGAFDTGLADLITNQIGVEEQNIVTDPLLNAWQDKEGKEVTDECRNFFAPKVGGSSTANPETLAGTLANQAFAGKNYYLNDAFNLAGLALDYPGIPCLDALRLEPKFTSPNPVNAGELVGLDGQESDISLDWAYYFGSPTATYPVYTWNFGDGTPTVSGYAPGSASVNSPGASPCAQPWLSPCAGSVFHSFKYGGTYEVTLTVRDVAGNTASVTSPITVDGPGPPSESSSGSSSSGSSSGSGSSGAATPATPPAAPVTPPVPLPVAAAQVLSHSLPGALRKGLVVSYSVNEQVAGHFEVLLNRALARRLGISGTPAVGLPAGTPPELVIAKAILITTKGGRGSVSIQFSKRTAARLAHVHKVTLLLRLTVRNASSHSPATTTVLSEVTLGR